LRSSCFAPGLCSLINALYSFCGCCFFLLYYVIDLTAFTETVYLTFFCALCKLNWLYKCTLQPIGLNWNRELPTWPALWNFWYFSAAQWLSGLTDGSNCISRVSYTSVGIAFSRAFQYRLTKILNFHKFTLHYHFTNYVDKNLSHETWTWPSLDINKGTFSKVQHPPGNNPFSVHLQYSALCFYSFTLMTCAFVVGGMPEGVILCLKLNTNTLDFFFYFQCIQRINDYW